MESIDSKDPLTGIVNKSIDLAEEVGKIYLLDEEEIAILATNLRKQIVADVIQLINHTTKQRIIASFSSMRV